MDSAQTQRLVGKYSLRLHATEYDGDETGTANVERLWDASVNVIFICRDLETLIRDGFPWPSGNGILEEVDTWIRQEDQKPDGFTVSRTWILHPHTGPTARILGGTIVVWAKSIEILDRVKMREVATADVVGEAWVDERNNQLLFTIGIWGDDDDDDDDDDDNDDYNDDDGDDDDDDDGYGDGNEDDASTLQCFNLTEQLG